MKLQKLEDDYGIVVSIMPGDSSNLYRFGELVRDMKKKINELVDEVERLKINNPRFRKAIKEMK